MEVVNLFIAIGSFYFAYRAAKYAKQAWLNPVPLLTIEEAGQIQESQQTIEVSGEQKTEYHFTIQHKVTNNGNVHARIIRATIEPEPTTSIVTNRSSMVGGESPPFTIEPGKTILLRTVISFAKRPEKVSLKIHTPNRLFTKAVIIFSCDSA